MRTSHGDKSTPKRPVWRIAVDTGGTFTDCIAEHVETGRLRRVKTLSSGALRARVVDILSDRELRIEASWLEDASAVEGFQVCSVTSPDALVMRVLQGNASGVLTLDRDLAGVLYSGDLIELQTGEPAPIIAARLATGTSAGRPLPPIDMRLATTRATNALLEGSFDRPAFFVTRGFADLLRIGDQRRPDLFAHDIVKPDPIHGDVYEVDERIDASGAVLTPLNDLNLEISIKRARDAGATCGAVALMHAWRNPAHEHRVRDELKRAGFTHVSISSELGSAATLVPRARTAVVNAALARVMRVYLHSIENAAPGASIRAMTSAGGLKPMQEFQPVDGLLSGPAGGVIGAQAAGAAAEQTRILTFDMGGTSTDVARIEGEPVLEFEHRVGDATILSPAVRIETVAAGGGSICEIHDGAPRVGPRSAGADPGPACYGAGGPLTITDVNALLGRLDLQRFGASLNIDDAAGACARALGCALDDIQQEHIARALQGFLDLANEHMAEAIRRISVREGYDPADYALIVFGGAGPQHACAVADRLGCDTVIVPQDAGLLSAAGVRAAPNERTAERTILSALPRDMSDVRGLLQPLEQEATASLQQGAGAKTLTAIALQRLIELRLEGQSFSFTIDWDGQAPLLDTFESRFKAMFGFAPDDASIELVSIRVVARQTATSSTTMRSDARKSTPESPRSQRAWFGKWTDAPVIDRLSIQSADHINGPALITEAHCATVVERGWRAHLGNAGELQLQRDSSHATTTTSVTTRAAQDQLVAHRLTAIAEQMGATLQRAALSTNVKERLDYSCAVLSPEGEVVASAPHIPVHLGALGFCVRRLMESMDIGPGDVVLTNHPAFGGSHLPDLTIVAPVHANNGQLLGWTASRAHHAEIGGVRPGSMPPQAMRLDEEGVVIEPMRLVQAGEAKWEALRYRLLSAPHPTRAIRENVSDLSAALAAARHAEGALRSLADEYGADIVTDAMRATLERTNRAVQRAIAARAPLNEAVEETMDDGSRIAVRIEFRNDTAMVDFAGSSNRHPGNLNAPLAVVHSAVAYVMRLLIDDDVPINDGLLRSTTIHSPPGMLNPQFDDPADLPAVAGGNVETSQRVVCALLRALNWGGDSQATMNNVIFGNATCSHYETLAGGAGATARADGASCVHVHMTNTAITDPEVMELRLPVRLRQCAIRARSGGAGAHRGGDGMIREIEFLEPVELSVLTQHRVQGPRGASGGADGLPGAQELIRANGERVSLGAVDGAHVDPGDRLIIDTPGGGGWGSSTE